MGRHAVPIALQCLLVNAFNMHEAQMANLTLRSSGNVLPNMQRH